LETERTISNDWVIHHEGGYLQLQPATRRYGPTKSQALVCEWEDPKLQGSASVRIPTTTTTNTNRKRGHF
jgi:hypothetical protein